MLVTSGCHLCDEACSAVEAVCRELDVGWTARPLSELAADAQARWREYVPVILVDGEVHDIFRVAPDRLRSTLAGRG